jgi:hypothetical protein
VYKYRDTYLLGQWYPIQGAGLAYTELANWESLPSTRLLEILGNEIPSEQESPSISVVTTLNVGHTILYIGCSK